MAIDNVNVVDGLAVDRENGILYLLLTDHLAWSGKDTLCEKDHLFLLQKKINAYISFVEAGQYKDNYPDVEVKMVVVEIHFQYEIPTVCKRFLEVVQNQIVQLGIQIQTHIG